MSREMSLQRPALRVSEIPVGTLKSIIALSGLDQSLFRK
jgi:hypothetical protein